MPDELTPPLIAATPRPGALPLSFSQERQWFISQMIPDSGVYNIPSVLRLTGRLDLVALERSLIRIAERHESLRTTFDLVDGQPVQVVASAPVVPFSVVDLRDLPLTDAEAEALRSAEADAQAPFDLSSGPLLRVAVTRLSDEDYLLLVTFHHSVSDRWSLDIFFRELRAFYEELVDGHPSNLPALPVQYADYARWERAWLTGTTLEEQLEYWREKLGGDLPVLELPNSRQRPSLPTYRGERIRFMVPVAVLDAVKAVSRQERVTLFMTLLAAFNVLLHRYTGQTDIVVGSPIAHRTRLEVEDLIGCFINTLALRSHPGENPSFRTFLGQVRETCFQAYEHQDLPFEKLVEELHPQRSLSHSPIFQTMLIVNAHDVRSMKPIGDVTISRAEINTSTAKFDLTLTLTESADGLSGQVEYSTDLFEAEDMARVGVHFETLLESIVADPVAPIGELPILSPSDRRQLLVEWNSSERKYPTDRSFVQLIEAQAARTPDDVAIICGDQELRYQELNGRANQLARHLRGLGVGRDALVGIYLNRSIDLLVALLGVAKAGAAYVPLDPIYPPDRIAYILEDAQASVLVTHQNLIADAPFHVAQVLSIDAEAPTLAGLSRENLPEVARSSDLAYVIYTSGSTGKPKGVMIEHLQLVNFLCSMAERPGFTADDVLVAITTISFDIAALELYVPLLSGGRVIMATSEVAADGRRLAALINDADATMLQATPATWQMLLDSGWNGRAGLRMLSGGEALPADLAQRLLDKGSELWNMFGPTETTIWSTVDRVEPDSSITIGRPIANTQTYVLSDQCQLVPQGVTGELWIGGVGLARGYLNRPDLTEERFRPDPFRDEPGARLYRTGDLARHRADGRLECLGRTDHQVKIRGFRIELGEIEAVLKEHPGVRDAVVVPQARSGDVRLSAYLISDPHQEPTVSELRRFARAQLPEYMVPAAVVGTDAFPLTPNGKVDRRALVETASVAAVPQTPIVEPETPMEQRVAAIWQEVLGVERVSRHDNFFDIGGHSLLAIRVIAQLEKETGLHINPREMFLQTLQQLAGGLSQAHKTS